MVNKILGTAGTKVFAAIVGFIIITINAKLLGAEAVGTIALIILGVTISILLSSLGGGSALVYLTPRHHPISLYVPAVIWTVISTSIVIPILYYFNWIPREFTIHVYVLSILRGWSNNHSTILLGKERIHRSNVISILEVLTILLLVLVFYFHFSFQSVSYYVNALIIAYAISMIYGLISIVQILRTGSPDQKKFGATFMAIVRYSIFIQLASFFQLMNYRLGYYFLEFFLGRGSVGIYSVGVRISETLWIVGKSISTVQYARISNTDNREYATNLTMIFFKVILVLTLVLCGVLIIIPEAWYLALFGQDFMGIKNVIVMLAPGTIALASTMAFSSLFAGLGKHHFNTVGSLIGLGITLIAGFILIPKYGISGAAITASFSYISSLLYYFIIFFSKGYGNLSMLMPSKSDYLELKRLILKK